MVSINSNIASMTLQRSLARASNGLQRNMERLSSGSRLNRPSDDAAGLAIASALRANTRVYTQAIRNLNDGNSFLSINQGAVGELKNVAVRMRELAAQSANGVYSNGQRQALNVELRTLIQEYNRIIGTTRFNGLSILDRGTTTSVGLQAGYDSLQLGLNQGLARSRGSGNFDELGNVSLDGDGFAVVADFDNDGRSDVARWGLGQGRISIALGDGQGGFNGIGNTSAIGQDLTQLVAADFNGDGHVDIIGGGDGAVFYYQGNGDGTFQDALSFNLHGSTLTDLAFGDFNADGKLDFAALSDENLIEIFIGNGAGAFLHSGTQSDISVAAGTSSLQIADLNGDGRDDILSLNTTSRTIQVRLGTSVGISSTVTYQAQHAEPISSVAIGDLNGDGIQDIVVGNTSGKSPEIRLGTGAGGFGAISTITGYNGPVPTFVKLADFNSDGHLDLLLFAESSNLRVFSGRGNGTFETSAYSISSGNFTGTGLEQAVQIGDIDGDGVLDIFGFDSSQDIFSFRQDSEETSTIAFFDILSQESARRALDTTEAVLSRLETELATIGSHQSRLQVATGNLLSLKLGEAAAEDRITSADIAEESGQLIKNTILQQTAALVSAQANLMPELALRLLSA